MKKILLLLLLAGLNSGIMYAQHFEITPMGGYVFPGSWYTSSGSLYFNGGAQYGGIFSFGASRVMDFNFIYNRIDSKADLRGYYVQDRIPISMNYWMLGGTKNFRVNEIVSPFVSFSLGGCVMAPKSTDTYSYGSYNYWFFAMGADAGVKVYFSKVLGIRIQGQLLMPVQSAGFYFSGGGSSVYLTSTLVQFGFNGGLIFRIGQY